VQDARTVCVFNATEKGARGVIHGLLERGIFNVRAITPHPTGKRATNMLVEANNKYPGRFTLVEGDVQSLSVAELSKMMANSYGAFFSTNYWKLTIENQEERINKEEELGRKIADAVKKAKVNFFIFAGHEDIEEKFKFKVAPFVGKSRIENYLKNQGLTYASTRYAFDYDQFRDSSFMSIKEKPEGSGKYVWTIAVDEHKPIPLVNAHDAGYLVADMFNDKEKYAGQVIDVASEMLTPRELISSFTEVTGVPCEICLLEDASAAANALFAPEVSSMYRYYNMLDTSAFDSGIAQVQQAYPSALTFNTWQKENMDWYKQLPFDVYDDEITVTSTTKTTTTTSVEQGAGFPLM
jgi:hypothetical protein